MTIYETYVFDLGAQEYDRDAAIRMLDEQGFIVLRNAFQRESVAYTIEAVADYTRRPAVAGVPGYWKVDHPKKIFNPCLLGGPVFDLLLNEKVIELVETYMDSECVLAEANVKVDEPVGYEYFPLHSDFTIGWKKNPDAEEGLTAENLADPVGVGAAIYLHDTTEGAFSYCVGTHKQLPLRGADLADYPPDERRRIEATKKRIDGKSGDLVLFDDRGFHGPDQPSGARRTVILLDYYRVKTFGFRQVSPMPIWSCDLTRLSPRQLRVFGAGADYMVAPEEYMGARFRRNRLYGIVTRLIENAYLLTHFKQLVKSCIRGRTN